jgi:hypothetical protein
LASLSGFTTDIRLSSELTPDVVRVNGRAGRLLIGDAKATEDPSSRMTLRRLEGYALAGMRWQRFGLGVVLVVCHGRVSDSGRWLDALIGVAARIGARVCESGSFQIAVSEVVAWVELISSVEPQLARS